MSWIQENKFVAAWAGTTAVLGGTILFFGFSQGGAYEEGLENYESLKGQYLKLEKSTPYPNASNLSEREDGLDVYESTIKEVGQSVMDFCPEELEMMSPEQFKDARVQMEAELLELFKNSGTRLPENCAFGFEDYTDGAVRAGATAKLNYQLGAIQWALSALADAKPISLNNIRRVSLAEESGKSAVAPPEKPRRGRGRVRNTVKAGGATEDKAYELMPVELSFTASEASVRQFMTSLVNSKEYFYAVQSLRVRNERAAPPNQSDVDFPVEEEAGGGFGAEAGGGFGNFEDVAEGGEELTPGKPEPAAEPELPAGELILKQVLGSEDLHVHLCFDVVLIADKTEKAEKVLNQSKPEEARPEEG